MEHSIIISLAEYNELKDIKNNFQKAFDEKKTIVFHDSYFPGHSGYPVHKFSVVNNDEFAKDLLVKIERLEKLISKLNNENYELKEKLNEKPNKKSRWLWF